MSVHHIGDFFGDYIAKHSGESSTPLLTFEKDTFAALSTAAPKVRALPMAVPKPAAPLLSASLPLALKAPILAVTPTLPIPTPSGPSEAAPPIAYTQGQADQAASKSRATWIAAGVGAAAVALFVGLQLRKKR